MVSLPFPVGIRKGKFFTGMYMTGCSVLAYHDSNHWLKRSRPTQVSRERNGVKKKLLKYMDGILIHRLHEHLNQLWNLTNPSLAPFESGFSCLETVNLQVPCRAAVQRQKHYIFTVVDSFYISTVFKYLYFICTFRLFLFWEMFTSQHYAFFTTFDKSISFRIILNSGITTLSKTR